MHTNRISLARKILLWLSAASMIALFAGCESVRLTNLTEPNFAENPSQIYTFTLRVARRATTVPLDTITPHIVIDGKSYDMKKSQLPDCWEFEYQLPAGRDELAYYYLVGYQIENSSGRIPGESYTEVTHAKIVRRYVLTLETKRGPVGARVSLLGRGFTAQDTVYFGDSPARTVFESPNAISFYVPALEPGRNYQVNLNSAAGNSSVGPFHIDPSSVTVSPSSLTLRTGESQTVSFTVQTIAPPGGLLLDITTDAPESIIMPEVIIPQGQSSVIVTVTGGKAGNGSLFLKGYGNGEVSVPFSVSGK